MKKFLIFILLLLSLYGYSEQLIEPWENIVEIDNILYEIKDDYAIITNYPVYEDPRREYFGEIILPGSIQYQGRTYPVKKVAFNAFRSNRGLKSVVIEEGIEEIDTLAFAYCDSLQSVSFPNSLRTIHEAAFVCCFSLQSVVLWDSIRHIGAFAFGCCNSLQQVCLPKHYYDEDACHYVYFSDLSKLQSAVLTDEILWAVPRTAEGEYVVPEGIKMIAAEAFCGCDKLTKITLPQSLVVIGREAFAHCSALRSINIPNSVTDFGSFCFKGDNQLEEPIRNDSIFVYLPASIGSNYVIPDGITQIHRTAFSDAQELRTLVIPEGVSSMVIVDFLRSCPELRELTIPESMGDVWFWNHDHAYLKTIHNSHLFVCLNPNSKGIFAIPNGIKTIAQDAFRWCSQLDSIYIPNTVDSIGDSAFFDCVRLRHMTIPKEVRYLGYDLFCRCSGLISIRLEGAIPPLTADCTYGKESDEWYSEEDANANTCDPLGLPADIVIYVPKGSMERYKSTQGWSKYSNYVEYDR